MTDQDFIEALKSARASGDKAKMTEVMATEGSWERLLPIAERGLARIAKAKARNDSRKTLIPDEFPDAENKAKAVTYWNMNRRPDLAARVEEIAGDFHAHHFNKNERFVSWPIAWRTWYQRSIRFERPPQGQFSAPVLFEQTDMAGWERRLRLFYGLEHGTPKGAWSGKWGGEPGTPNFKGPEEVLRTFDLKRVKT